MSIVIAIDEWPSRSLITFGVAPVRSIKLSGGLPKVKDEVTAMGKSVDDELEVAYKQGVKPSEYLAYK